jgi:hydrogenase expression/formation protein HypE
LIDEIFGKLLSNPALDERHDGASLLLPAGTGRIAMSTDSFVVNPLFFPGGDIGTLAVNGTVNDLAMCGARPLWLSCGAILEEGVQTTLVRRIVESISVAAKEAGVQVVTGDTKVVDRGKGDGVYLNTTGVGVIESTHHIGPAEVSEGDAIIVSGDIGRHGIAIMAVREGLEFETTIESDCAPLWKPVQSLLASGIDVHCLRDLTRGGLSSALCEIAEIRKMGIRVVQPNIPVREDVQGACEILGLDPMYVANEGRFVAFVAKSDAEKTLAVLRAYPNCADAAIIGTVGSVDGQGRVIMRSTIGVDRIVDMLSGEQLPRIC